MTDRLHPSHITRGSDASTFDEICINCGATDEVPGRWGRLALPCPNSCQCPAKHGEDCPLTSEECIARIKGKNK